MKKLLLLCAAVRSPAYSVCQSPTIPTSPGQVANSTKLDEQAAVTAHLAYKSWRLAVETSVNAGLIKGQLAAHVAQLDNQLYSALQAVDAAYASGNATNYARSSRGFNTASLSATPQSGEDACSASQEFSSCCKRSAHSPPRCLRSRRL
jgi:hypothetical protein